MNTPIDLAKVFAEQNVLETVIREAEAALSSSRSQLQAFNQHKKEELVGELLAGQTTGDPLQDEIVSVFGADRNAIVKILAFNQKLMEGQGILIAVHRSECFKHVMIPTPSNQNEYITRTGYIYGIPSGERLVIRRCEEKLPRWQSNAVVLPFKRYAKWGFERGDTEFPVEGNLSFGENLLGGDLDTFGFLSSIIKDTSKPHQSRELDILETSEPGLEVFFDYGDQVDMGLGLVKNAQIRIALRHGRKLVTVLTPAEKEAAANI